MQHYTNTVTNFSGDRVVGAVATVTDLNGVAASLYADFAGTIPIGYQVTTDTHGVFSFYAAIGRYNIVVSGSGIATYSILDVFIGDVELVAQLALSTGSSTIGHIASGTGAVARTVQSKLRDEINIRDFGTDATAFINALASLPASGGKITVPAGTYNLPFSSTTCLSPGANVTISGEGKLNTIINFVPDSTSYRNLIAIDHDGLCFEYLTLKATVPSGGAVSMFVVAASNITINDCIIDGVVTNAGAVMSHYCYGFNMVTSGTQNNITVKNSKLTRMTYPWINTNLSTSTQKYISFTDNEFVNNYYSDLSFNNPNSICDNVTVVNNIFHDNLTISASLSPVESMAIALASVSNFTISGNKINGSYHEAIHIEEQSEYGSITGNVTYSDGTGIAFNGNNVNTGAVNYFPQYVEVSGNSFNKSGTLKEALKYGVILSLNVTSITPCKSIQIVNNIINGYDFGLYQSVTLDDNCMIRNNTFNGCAKGIGSQDGSGTVSDNISSNCDVGVTGITAGYPYESSVYQNHTFIACTANVTAVDLPITLLNPYFIFAEFSHPGGATSVYKAMVQAGANCRIHGFVESAEVNETSTNSYAMIRDEVTWDGAVFTRTNKIAINPGAIVNSSVNNAGFLSIQVFSASATTNIRLQAKLNGMAVVSV